MRSFILLLLIPCSALGFPAPKGGLPYLPLEGNKPLYGNGAGTSWAFHRESRYGPPYEPYEIPEEVLRKLKGGFCYPNPNDREHNTGRWYWTKREAEEALREALRC